ncbi:hypothetical protein B0H12DRAFT_1236060 [Mycena haematopus]|nr:hypothetical protein B0H12DRAFT_1236060 [Mycena haematopus]
MKALILLLFLFWLMAQFSCQAPCPRSFADARTLRIHQNSCEIFRNAQNTRDQQAAVEESAFERMRRKRRRTEEPQPSTSSPEPTVEPLDVDVEMPAAARDSSPPPPPSSPPERPPSPQFTAARRPIRAKRKTWKLLEQLPEPVPPVVPRTDHPESEPAPPTPLPTPAAWVWSGITTAINHFGLFREYPAVPTYNPDKSLTIEELSNVPGGPRVNTTTIPTDLTPFEPDLLHDTPAPPGLQPPAASSSSNPYAGLFPNWSIGSLMTWQWTGSTTKSVEEGIKLVDILKDDRFSQEDIKDFDFKRETAKLDKYLATSSNSQIRDSWKSTSVNISVPDEKKYASEADAPVFAVPDLFYRPIVEVIKAAIRDVGDRCFHYTPFKQFWQPSPDSAPRRIYDEIYSSEAMVEAHTALQNQLRQPGCTLERLPDSFHDFYKELTGHAPPPDVLTHCRPELMHAIWCLLLDDEFLDAYEHGIVIECQDGIFRRFFPRFFTYSADYPEKVLLATIRNLAKAPCPRCYLPKEEIPNLGTVQDKKKREKLARTDEHIQNGTITRIRDWIFRLGRSVKSSTFDYFLLARSWTPTLNAFSDQLGKFGLDPFKMLVPDFMHEFELGVFKAFFIHLLRILYAHGGGAIATLNERFRWIPTFGRSTIRRFTLNTSALKKMAAWNYQNILLCSIPVLEDLLPELFNSEILDLLFTFAEWHTLAKLKLHTDPTLERLDSVTTVLGCLLRRFKRVVCPEFATKELPSEEAARGRRQAKKAAQGKGKGRATIRKTTSNAKEFNLQTYKLHALGDYVPAVRWFGTSDSYSTQPGELEHRRVKGFYARTNKNKPLRQMTQLERRNTTLNHKKKAQIPFDQSESLPYTSPEQHHHISPSRNFSLHLTAWLQSNYGDPAVTDFLPKLQEHVLSRLAHPDWTEEDAPHPFAYAQVIGIFHADFVNTADANAKLQSIEFLCVRRYQLDPTYRSGFKRKRYHRVQFHPQSDPDAFGFLNPDEVIRGAHLIPAFAHGRTTDLLSSGSIGRVPWAGLTDDEDWKYYYVNFFVDRDMYMHYIGGGVGHYQVPIPPEEALAPPDDNEDNEVLEDTPPGPSPIPTPLEHQSPSSAMSGKSDSGSESDDSVDDSGEEDEDEPNIGPEDAEIRGERRFVVIADGILTISIADSKEDARDKTKRIGARGEHDGRGDGKRDKVKASRVHTAFRAEVCGAILALDIISGTPWLTSIDVFMDR